MVELIMKLHPCADCPIRCKAVAKPHSLFARIHRWHRTWWPGWKVYQAELRAPGVRAEVCTPTAKAPVTLVRGIEWGLIGGLAGTLVMDLVLMGALLIAGLPAFTCFSIVGATVARFLSISGITTAGSIPLGVATHYLIGPVVGALFGAAVVLVDAFRVTTLKKSILLSFLYVEILSQPLLATTPILLKMTTHEMLQWYGASFVMHALLAVVLGVVTSYGLRLRKMADHR